MAVLNTAPTFTIGRTGFSVNPKDNRGGLNTIVQLPDGKLLMTENAVLYRFNADGSPDVTFGNEGEQRIVFNTEGSLGHQQIRALHILADGKMLLSGSAAESATSRLDYMFVLARLNADGSFDTSFGNGTGQSSTNLDPGRMEFELMTAVLPDGRVVVATGSWELDPGNGATATGMRIVLARYLQDGSLDASFGNKGITIGTSDKARVENMTVQADGKIIVVGTDVSSYVNEFLAVHRFNADGSVDTTFDRDGLAQTSFDPRVYNTSEGAYDVAVQSDGKIVVVGVAQMGLSDAAKVTNGIAVARYNTDGSLDSTFGNAGKLVYWTSQDPILSKQAGAAAREVQIADDGKILIGGISSERGDLGTSAAFSLLRLHPDGRIDEQFGNAGIATISGGWNASMDLLAMQMMVDGSIVVAGTVTSWGGPTLNIMARFTAGGALDNSFGGFSTASRNSTDYLVDHPEQFLNEHLHISDVQLNAIGDYDGASVMLVRAGGKPNANDAFGAGGGLRFANGHAILDGVDVGAVTIASGTLRITFGPGVTQALVNKTLQSIVYENTAAVAGQAIAIDWSFSDGNAGAQGPGAAQSANFSTSVSVARTDVPYWIAALLQPDSQVQSAQELKASLHTHIGTGNSLNVAFGAAAGASAFSSDEKFFIQKTLVQLQSVIGLGFGSGAETLTFINSAELPGADGTAEKLGDDGAHVAFSFGAAGTAANTFSASGELLHNLGHVFGLKHGHEPGIRGSQLPLAENTDSVTVMAGPMPAVELPGAVQDFGVLDIAALQYLYGPNASARAGNDIHLLNGSTSNFIWDGAGTDTISGEGIKLDMVLHLEPGHWDYIGSRSGLITAAGQATVNFGTAIENAVGGSGNDQLTGNGVANHLSGSAGNDRLQGLGGNDELDGGAGLDTAVYAGAHDAYTVARTSTGLTITSKAAEGIDTLLNIERLQFADKHVAFDPNAVLLYRLYDAVFGRAPDQAGLGFWMNAMDTGMSATTVAGFFTTTVEFRTAYGAQPDSTTLVTHMYQNVLGRAPDELGLAFWKSVLDSSAISTAELLVSFSESPENVAKLVGVTELGVDFKPFI